MGLVVVSMEVQGERFYSRGFEALAHEVEDMSDPLGEVGDLLLNEVNMQFLTSGVHGGGSMWAPLSPEYSICKIRRWGARPLLVASGLMKRQMLNKAQAIQVGRKRLIYEPVSDYAGYHQSGTARMPQRKIVEITLASRRGIDRAFASWLTALRRRTIGT